MTAASTPAQRTMLLASEPDDITGAEGCGVELTSGALYATAKALGARGFGQHTGPGGPLPGMYWSNGLGLAERERLLRPPSREADEDDHDLFGYPYGTTIDFRGSKRTVFYEHEGDHVIIWWFPGDEATHGPADATEAEASEIYGRLWAEMEDRWAAASEYD